MSPSLTPLPELGAISALKTPAKVLLARIAQGSSEGGDVQSSQRYLAMEFNRTQRASTAGWLRSLRGAGLIEISNVSRGLRPHAYSLASRIHDDDTLLNAVLQLADVLYGDNGLLKDWPYPATWGHGALNASGTLVLAVLIPLEEPVSADFVVDYLRPLVKPRTVRTALAKLHVHAITDVEEDQIYLRSDWEDNLNDFLDSCAAGTERLDRGNAVRRSEWARSQELYRGSGLSNYDLYMLHGLPCVYCKGPSNEQEHFPPRRFLKFHGVESDRHHIWAICRTCNSARSRFVKSLPLDDLPFPNEWHFRDPAELGAINGASANYHLNRFNRAFAEGDKSAAVRAINATITLMRITRTVGVSRFDDVSPVKEETKRRRPNTFSTEQSQIVYRQVAHHD